MIFKLITSYLKENYMLKKIYSPLLLLAFFCAAFSVLHGAVPEFQVTFLPGPDEPVRRESMKPETFGSLFALRLS